MSDTIYNADAMSADEMLYAISDLQHRVWGKAPELVEETVTDDGETYQALRCPVCGLLVNDAGSLYAVDISERWSSAEPDMDNREMDVSGADSDYGDTLYYLHDTMPVPHAVVPPVDWRENWR